MQSIQLKTRVGQDGILQIQMPSEMQDTELEVFVVFNPIASDRTPQDIEKGWPKDYFESTYGSCQDDPIAIDGEGISDVLDDNLDNVFN